IGHVGRVAADDDALAVGILRLPHPLLADDEYFHRVLGRVDGIAVDHRAPAEEREEDNRRQKRPGEFEPLRAEDARRRAGGGGAASAALRRSRRSASPTQVPIVSSVMIPPIWIARLIRKA